MLSLFGPNKRINQELYKKNAELAFQNKTLSLFRRLYTTTLATLEAKTLARNLVDAIRADFNFRIVGIYNINNEGTELTPLAVSFFNTDKEDLKNFFGKIAEKSIPFATTNIAFRKALDTGNRQVTADIKEVWTKIIGIDKLAKLANISSTAIYPLKAENKIVGIFLASFNNKFNDLTTYEVEALEGISNIVAIALDKALVYGQLEDANEKLAKQNLRLQELDRQKTDFLSIATHQLRTPLSIMSGYIELIKDGAYGKVGDKVKSILRNMDQSNMRLVELVDDFLDITRIEQGRTKYEFKPTDIAKVVDNVVHEFKNKAHDKGIKFDWDPHKELPLVACDGPKIRHVALNFIDNALKYSGAGVIKVWFEEEDGGIAFRVHDNGLGFERVDEANFFQKFYRGLNVKGVNVSGTGLGLYVCRMFIEAHSGRIWAHSRGLGKGSEFGFWLPLTQKEETITHPEKGIIPGPPPESIKTAAGEPAENA